MNIDEQDRSYESDNSIPSSLGEWLRASRVAAGLTIEDIGRALKLAGSTVQDLESDRTKHIGAPIYYKGFVRAYAKILDLPQVAVETRLSALIDTDPMPRVTEGTIRVKRSRWMERYTWMASYVVGTALVLPLLYWLVSSDTAPRLLGGSEPRELVLPQAEGPRASVPFSEATDSAVETEDGSTDQETQLAGTATGTATTSPDSAAENSLSPPVAASLTPFGLGRGATSNASSDQLVLELDSAGWVSLTDATGEKIVYRTLPAGRHVFGGTAPLALRLGNASRSRLFIAGQAVDLQAYVRGNIANLSLRATPQGALQADPASAAATETE